jgi:NodT family efflux transporter outer membrane factor (OMF) lipoprotein
MQPQQEWDALHVTADPAAVLAEDWWTDFGDADLDEAVGTALANNFDLMAAAARVQSVAAQARAIAGDRLPQVNAGLDLSRSRQNFIGLPVPGAPEVLPITSERHTLGLDLSWELDLWGRLEANEQAAVARLESSDADYAAAKLSLAGQTAKAWLAHREAIAQKEIASALASNAEELKAYAQLRFENGAPADMVHQSAAAAAAAQAALPASDQQAQIWGRQLATLLGEYPTLGRNTDGATLPPLPGPVPAGLPATLVGRRPDLVSLESKVRSAYASSRAADASLYPALSLTGAFGISSAELGDLLDADFKTWSLGASLTAPIFHGGALEAQAEAAESLAHAAELQFAQALLRALAEVEIALDNERLIQERLTELETQIAISRNRSATAQQRFQSGVGDAGLIYTTRADVLRACSSRLSAELLLLTNRIDLYLALGGGFQNPHQR